MEGLPMKKNLLAPLLAAGACAQAASPAPPPAPKCDLTISFGSYAMGIDQGALAAVRRILADRAVRSVLDTQRGPEGEIHLCTRTRRPADAARLFNRIRAVLPAAPRGPIAVRTASGLRFDAPPRR
jgi:hypothetical protein